MSKAWTSPFLFCIALAATTPARGEGILANLIEATPVGSWQVRETVTTDDKGKQTVVVTRSSNVGAEERNGQAYLWLEMEVTNFEVKGAERKAKKDGRQVVKVLVKKDAFATDPANLANNLAGFGEEIIFQGPDGKAMRIRGAGGMAGAMMKAMDTKVNYSFTELGEEKVETPAGNFVCKKVRGSGDTELKIMFKTMRVTSESEIWMTEKVPFGMVKSKDKTTTDGKLQTSETTLLEYGMTGAVSKITGEVTEMPDFGSMFGGAGK